MEVSGVIHKLWKGESKEVKAKFAVAAKAYTLERDELVALGLPKIALKTYMLSNLERFQLGAPDAHIIQRYMETTPIDTLSNMKEFLLADGQIHDMIALSEKLHKASPQILENFISAVEAKEEELGLNTESTSDSGPTIRFEPAPSFKPLDMDQFSDIPHLNEALN